MNGIPYEIIAQPYTLYLADVGSVFPSLDEEPGVSWLKVGTSGDRNYTEDGVTIAHDEKDEIFRALGSTGPMKAFRAEEDLKISLMLADLTLEQYAIILNGNTITTTPPGSGTVGYKKIGLSKGLDVKQYALLARGPTASAYGNRMAQYEVPLCFQSAGQEVTFQKGTPAALALEFTALEDPNAASEDERFGRLLMENADAET